MHANAREQRHAESISHSTQRRVVRESVTNGSFRSHEHEQKAIALVDLDATVSLEQVARHAVMTSEQLRATAIAETAHEARALHQIGEDQRALLHFEVGYPIHPALLRPPATAASNVQYISMCQSRKRASMNNAVENGSELLDRIQSNQADQALVLGREG